MSILFDLLCVLITKIPHSVFHQINYRRKGPNMNLSLYNFYNHKYTLKPAYNKRYPSRSTYFFTPPYLRSRIMRNLEAKGSILLKNQIPWNTHPNEPKYCINLRFVCLSNTSEDHKRNERITKTCWSDKIKLAAILTYRPFVGNQWLSNVGLNAANFIIYFGQNHWFYCVW